MMFIDLETEDVYRLLSKDALVYLEAKDHSVYVFELAFFEKHFKQIKLVKCNAGN